MFFELIGTIVAGAVAALLVGALNTLGAAARSQSRGGRTLAPSGSTPDAAYP